MNGRMAAGMLMAALLLAGCGRRPLTERDQALCVRVADFKKCGWNFENLQMVERYQFEYDRGGIWMVNYLGKGYDEAGEEILDVEFTASCGPLVVRAGFDGARGQMENQHGWVRGENLIAHAPKSFVFQHVRGGETNATMACWMESGKMFRLNVGGLPILSAEDFMRLIQDKTNGWATWDPGEKR